MMIIIIYHDKAEKMCLMEEEQDTGGNGKKNF